MPRRTICMDSFRLHSLLHHPAHRMDLERTSIKQSNMLSTSALRNLTRTHPPRLRPPEIKMAHPRRESLMCGCKATLGPSVFRPALCSPPEAVQNRPMDSTTSISGCTDSASKHQSNSVLELWIFQLFPRYLFYFIVFVRHVSFS